MSSSKILWRDEQRVTRLIELAIAEFNAGRVKNGKLGAPNYESIAAIMSVDVPILDAQKIKTKLDNMRTEFRMFEDLKSRTEFGWDPETKTMKADVERWSELLQIEEKYAKFMGRGLDHYDELCYIFGNHTATASTAMHPPKILLLVKRSNVFMMQPLVGLHEATYQGLLLPSPPAKVQVGGGSVHLPRLRVSDRVRCDLGSLKMTHSKRHLKTFCVSGRNALQTLTFLGGLS
ncbi:hypothetical protein CJ030_MR5G009730 [Morella rubra]|uniref:Myb/SANT-like domain-containing protein n=1 Tax=Morella rubra TaxID=262757 RepID=A0A6A1VLK4_9ROSI|nr:hypothetical protein CJ030_MR5G009730 [Morella rubra]